MAKQSIDDQIKQKQKQSQVLEKLWREAESGTYEDGVLWGKIELLGEQIAELNRAKDGRKQPEIHY